MTRICSRFRNKDKEEHSLLGRFASWAFLLVVFLVRSSESLAASSVSSSATLSSALPVTASTEISPWESVISSESVGFYVHIPYCRRRCRYCNFAIVPVGNNRRQGNSQQQTKAEKDDDDVQFNGSSSSLPLSPASSTSSFLDVIHEQYQADLFQEMDHLLLQPPTTTTALPLLKSIYFGGGTPSLAPVSMIDGILQRIRQAFPHIDDGNMEITMEMDPGTFDVLQLQALKDLGINRISLGVQSFDDTILEQLGRVHRKKDIDDAVQMIHQVFGSSTSTSTSTSGFSSDNHSINFSMDLISGVPGLTEAKWVDTLQQATTGLFASASHLSIYDLQVEEGTVFGRWYATNSGNIDTTTTTTTTTTTGASRHPLAISLPSEDSVARMYKFTAGYLRAKGFEHYEVSSYARYSHNDKSQATNPNRSRHNQIYWESSGSWYAVGLGATSCIQGKLQARPKTMADYHSWVQQMGSSTGDDSGSSELISSEDDLLTDIIMKRLRTSDGLDLEWIQERFGAEQRNTIVKGAQLGLELNLAQFDKDGARLRLVDPDGFLYSNYIISSIFAEMGYE